MTDALSVSHVKKSFKKPDNSLFFALNDVSMTIKKGTIHGLLGPNGAGKSTLISLISAIALPTNGVIEVFGVDVTKDPDATKQMLGVVPQEIVVEMAFTVEEVLYYFSGMYGVPAAERKERIAAVLTDLDLADKAKEKARTLSGGMKRRLMIAKAILHRPTFLILDEPTAGVDVALRQKIWELVRRLNAEGTTILFTTHYLEEAEQLCENITMLSGGKVVADGPLKDLQKGFAENMIRFELFDASAPKMEGVKQVGKEFVFPVTRLEDDITKITKAYDGNLKSLRTDTASLEEIFLELTK